MGKPSMYNKKLENALDYCLKLVNTGATVEECLKLYPNQRKDLKGLLKMAVGVKKAYPAYPELRPSKLYAKTIEDKLVAVVEGGNNVLERELSLYTIKPKKRQDLVRLRAGAFPKKYVLPASVALSLIIAAGGLVYASDGSLPGSPLYGIKRAAEAAQLAFTFDGRQRANLQHIFAMRRLAEAGAVAEANQKKMEASSITETGVSNWDWDQAEKQSQLAAGQDEASGSKSIAKTETKDVPSSRTSLDYRRFLARKAKKKNNKAVASTLTSKPLVSAAPFKIGSMSIFDGSTEVDYISPNKDGVRDTVKIRISSASSDNFSVVLNKMGSRVAVIARQTSGGDLDFIWDGKDIDGNRVPDGQYSITVVDGFGHAATPQKNIFVASLPELSLITPSVDSLVDRSLLSFKWSDMNIYGPDNPVSYSLYLTPASNAGASVVKSNLTGNSYQPDSQLNELLTPGDWKWRIIATDKAGNMAASDCASFRIKS